MTNKVLLLILDGWGLNADQQGNAWLAAKTPNIDELFSKYPSLALEASGPSVGLPEHTPGSSEVGHRAIGTGQVTEHIISRAEQDIKSGSFQHNEAVIAALTRAKERSKKVHLVGLLSDVIIHASQAVLYSLIEAAGQVGANSKLYLHLFLDGRDTQVRSGQKLVEQLYLQLRDKGYGSLATLIGRDFAMDRDGRWDKIERSWQLMTQLKGQTVRSVLEGVVDAYAAGQDDEHLEPLVIDAGGKIEAGDTVILFNHRSDRIRELAEKFATGGIPDLHVLAFTKYYASMPFATIYDQPLIEPNLVSTVTAAGKKVVKLSETERYAHLTYFFNGGREDPYPGEERSFVPSQRLADITQRPELSLRELTTRVEKACHEARPDLVIVNIPNLDALGHTGNLAATTLAATAVDTAVGRIIKAALPNYTTLITSDHGNCEYLLDRQSQEIRKEDTTNAVPLILISEAHQTTNANSYLQLASLSPAAVLTDIATTILPLLGMGPVESMPGIDLIAQGGLS